jgi:hypothetical protein
MCWPHYLTLSASFTHIHNITIYFNTKWYGYCVDDNGHDHYHYKGKDGVGDKMILEKNCKITQECLAEKAEYIRTVTSVYDIRYEDDESEWVNRVSYDLDGEILTSTWELLRFKEEEVV